MSRKQSSKARKSQPDVKNKRRSKEVLPPVSYVELLKRALTWIVGDGIFDDPLVTADDKHDLVVNVGARHAGVRAAAPHAGCGQQEI